MKKILFTLTLMLGVFTAKAQSCPDDNHPHMIDLGLPSGTLWSCCNVGASLPEEYGGYYAWGELEEKAVYNTVTYQYATGVDEDGNGWYDDYHSDTEIFGVWQDLGSDIAGTPYDAAHVKWGGSWAMPSIEQFEELLYNCYTRWAKYNEVLGRLFTGLNDNMLFLPAAGRRANDLLLEVGNFGTYWSSTMNPSRLDWASCLDFAWRGIDCSDYSRCFGFSVRPIISGTNNITLPAAIPTASNQVVYNVYGVKVADNLGNANTLPPGIYIVNGKKIVVK